MAFIVIGDSDIAGQEPAFVATQLCRVREYTETFLSVSVLVLGLGVLLKYSLWYRIQIHTHLLIDYKDHADVSFTDSLGLTGTSNMAHHQVFHAVWVGCISVSVSLSRRHSGSSPPSPSPPSVSACSIYCSFRLSATASNLRPARYIVLMSVKMFIGECFQPHIL